MKILIHITVVVLIFLMSCSSTRRVTRNPCDKNRILLMSYGNTNNIDFYTFSDFVSSLKESKIAKVKTDNPIVYITRIKGLSNTSKDLSMREIFDLVALQTESTWEFDSTRCYFVFHKQMPYVFDLADGWTKDLRDGNYFCKPSIAPVGMDIYFAGYVGSTQSKEEALLRISKSTIESFKEDLKKDDISILELRHHRAYYAEEELKEKDIMWRQWVIEKDGLCFTIVSAIDKVNDKKLLPDVNHMVNSFQIIE